MSAAKPLVAAVVVMMAAAGGLAYLGRTSSHDTAAALPSDSAASAHAAEAVPKSAAAGPTSQKRGPAPSPGPALRHAARALVPTEAWVVADFRGDLTGSRPFEDEQGSCKEVAAPPRVVLAILPPLSQSSQGPEMLLAAPAVSELFWGCARDRIVRAGGTMLAQNDQFEVLKSPSGVVALGPKRAMIFLSNEAYLERGLAVISDVGGGSAQDSGSATLGPHAALFRRIHPEASSVGSAGSGVDSPDLGSALDATLHLPPDWLASVGDEAKLSPLRHMQAASLSVGADGSARGVIDCAEPGCAAVHSFVQGAKRDLVAQLEPTLGRAVEAGLVLHYQPQAGQIEVTWTSSAGKIQNFLGRMLGGPRLFTP